MNAPQASDAGLARYVIGGIIAGMLIGAGIGLLFPSIGFGFGISIGMIVGIAGACALWFARRPTG